MDESAPPWLTRLKQALAGNTQADVALPVRNSRFGNFYDAKRDLNLTPQEQDFYSRHLSNLYGPGGVDNPDGSRSTLYQTTIEGPDDLAFTIPTVWNGRILSVPDAINEVRKVGIDAFPSYPTVDDAENRYGQLHRYMERDTGDYLKSRK